MKIYKCQIRLPVLFIAMFTIPFVSISQINKDSVATAQSKMLEELVVTGQYKPQSLGNSVYQIRIINQEKIKMRGATDIAGLLNNELGIRFSTDYTLGETDIRIAGMASQRVKVLLDGVPLVDRDGTKQSLAQIDINSIERIELVEGPMSVVYGTDALAGVINIITKKDTVSGLNITAKIQEESAGNSYSPFADEGIHNENLNVGWKNKAWQFSAYGTRNSSGGYTDSAAYPAKVAKPKDQWITGATLGLHTAQLHAWYRLDYLNEQLFSAGVMSVNNYKGFDQYYITNRYTHQLQADWQVSNSLKINSAASYQDYKRNTRSYLVDYRQGSKTPVDGDGFWDVSQFSTMFFRSTAQWVISPQLTVQPGVEVKSDRTKGQRITGTPSIQDYSIFASAEIRPLPGINIRPGMRFSKNSIYDAPPFIPSLNTKFSLSKRLDLRLAYARGFRAPILRELYFNFHDANHSIEGNASLKAEYSNSFTGSLTWQHKKISSLDLNTIISGFYSHFYDFIGMAYDDARQVYSYFNLSEYKTAGGSVENRLTYKNINASLGVSYIGRYNPYAETNKTLPAFNWSPEVNSSLMYKFPLWKAQVGIFYKFTGITPSYTVNSNNEIYLAKLGSWHYADVTASKQLFKYLTLQAGMKNIFNVKRIQNTTQNEGGAHSSGGAVLTGFGRSYFTALLFQLHP